MLTKKNGTFWGHVFEYGQGVSKIRYYRQNTSEMCDSGVHHARQEGGSLHRLKSVTKKSRILFRDFIRSEMLKT